ncbi:hypothetical protein [Polaromonas sp. CG9_12]|nr:hypothetical protein [Polaromonas sp. CG9_12]
MVMKGLVVPDFDRWPIFLNEVLSRSVVFSASRSGQPG